MLLMQPFWFKLAEVKPIFAKTTLLWIVRFDPRGITKIPFRVSKGTISHHLNVFVLMLSKWEGRGGRILRKQCAFHATFHSWNTVVLRITTFRSTTDRTYTMVVPKDYIIIIIWAGCLSRYSDWLRAGWSGIESRWGWDFPPVQTGPGAHPVSCKMGTRSFPRVKCGRGVLLITHPLLVPRSWKSRAIPLPILWATPGL